MTFHSVLLFSSGKKELSFIETFWHMLYHSHSSSELIKPRLYFWYVRILSENITYLEASRDLAIKLSPKTILGAN